MTSQIFANIYLNEFDRFVRRELRPLAYARYGDDFVVFMRNRREAFRARERGTEFLRRELGLVVNLKNDVVVPCASGLHFLGHVIMGAYAVVDRRTTERALMRVSLENLASYKALRLAKWPRRELDFRVFDEIMEIFEDF